MSAQRGVLAVMREAASWLPYDGDDREIQERFAKAIEAVSELVAAAKEVDRLSRDLTAWDDPTSVDRAVLRQRAALARMDPQPGEEQ